MPSINDVLFEINNYFDVSHEEQEYEITTTKIIGTLEEDYVAGQYVRILGSLLNDGVYKITTVDTGELTLDATLIAENTGREICLYGLAIPPALSTLITEITTNGTNEGIQSESVSRYSVSFGDGGKAWTNLYKKALNNYRKMRWN